MLRTLAAAALAVALAPPAQAVNLKELVFTGTVYLGNDLTGNVFGGDYSLVGKAASGRYVWDADRMPGTAAYSARYFDHVTPGWEGVLAAYWGGSTGPFMSATLTIDGITRPIEDTPQPSLPHGPARQTVTLDDHPEYAPWDFLSANVASYRPSCTCVAGEFMQLQATGAAASFLDGENPAQDFHVVLNNVHSLVHFQLLSGFTYGSTTVPTSPYYGDSAMHYATGYISLNTLTLRSVTAVPEPGTWALLAAGVGFVTLRLRQARRG